MCVSDKDLHRCPVILEPRMFCSGIVVYSSCAAVVWHHFSMFRNTLTAFRSTPFN